MKRLKTTAVVGLVAVGLLLVGALGPFDARETSSTSPTAKSLAGRALKELENARMFADPSALSRANALLDRSLVLQPRANFEAFVAMASLSNARHDFRSSVAWSHKAIDVNPHAASPYGLLGDALFELGDYRASEAAYQRMVELRPDVASYVRASYAFQFQGRTKAALAAMRLALGATPPIGETRAWVHHQLADIYLGTGRLAQARRHNRLGTRLAPGYAPPRVGLAEVHIARGELGAATRLVEDAADALPSLEYQVTLGELYAAIGRTHSAERQQRVAARTFAHYRANGVLPDVDFIVFYADHGLRTEAAVDEARRIYADRPTPAAADGLAWALHAAGRDHIAWRYVREAIESGPPDGMFHYHAAEIASALGLNDRALVHYQQARDLSMTLSVTARAVVDGALA